MVIPEISEGHRKLSRVVIQAATGQLLSQTPKEGKTRECGFNDRFRASCLILWVQVDYHEGSISGLGLHKDLVRRVLRRHGHGCLEAGRYF